MSQGTPSGTGPNTWAAFALAFYGKTYNDQHAIDAANEVTQWVINKLYDPTNGGVWGGICHPFKEKPGDHHKGDTRFPFKSTEQVIDTWHLLRIMGYDSNPERVAEWLTTDGKGWVEPEKRFAAGTNWEDFQDKSRFLDPQSWGSIVANMISEPDQVNGAIEDAEKYLLIGDVIVDGQKISGFSDRDLSDEPKIIWYGGTAQMIVA
ncbi:MAG: hypothetical protein AB1801_13325 [Chloroflexota bacterium]